MLSDVIMHQVLFEHTAILVTSISEAQSPSEEISSEKEWYQQTLKNLLSFKLADIPQLIPRTCEKETIAKITYLTSPIRLLQKVIIDNTKTINAILSVIELEEKKK